MKVDVPFVPSSGHSNRFPPRSPPNRLNLYFPPGGHTHDRHTIPPDRLHISFSDPVLVAAEQSLRLSNIPVQQNQPQSSTVKDATATRTIKLGPVAFCLRGGIFSHRLRDHGNEPPLVAQAVKTVAAAAPGPRPAYCWNAGAQAATPDPSSLNSLDDDSYDICEVVTVPGDIDGGTGNADRLVSENSRYGPGLTPLASELFKEELYIRGYLKRPASRPPNDLTASRNSITGLMVVTRKVFSKALGRRQGRKVAERLKTAQDTAVAPDNGLDAHLPENRISICVPLQTQHTDGQQSPGTDSNTSTSKSFDLHEFSYLTALTTPPSSPSVMLDGMSSKKAANLGEGNHAV